MTNPSPAISDSQQITVKYMESGSVQFGVNRVIPVTIFSNWKIITGEDFMRRFPRGEA
jgi:hypothetical protein